MMFAKVGVVVVAVAAATEVVAAAAAAGVGLRGVGVKYIGEILITQAVVFLRPPLSANSSEDLS